MRRFIGGVPARSQNQCRGSRGVSVAGNCRAVVGRFSVRPQAQARMRAGFNFQAGIFVESRNAATALEVAYQANLLTLVIYIEGEIDSDDLVTLIFSKD